MADQLGIDPGPVVPSNDLAAMSSDVGEALELAWKEVTTSASFIGGRHVERFEEQWAAYCGTEHAVGVANGTDALQLTLRALGIGAGDEVIVPANSFIATAEAVVLAGAVPRFADVDEETLLVTPDTIAPAINERTAAVIVVHLYGNVTAIEAISRLTDARRLALIEDAAQAHGSTWRGARAGSFGVGGCFSFFPGKNLGAFGDGGAVVTDAAPLAERIRSLRNHGRLPDASHVHTAVGTNSRLDALQAAVLSAKLPRLDEWNQARRSAVAAYRRLLDPAIRTVRIHDDVESCFHQHVVRIADRDLVREGLARRGIQTGIHYPIPCHLQRPYTDYAPDPLPAAERAAGEILSLPVFPHITHQQVRYVADYLNQLVKGTRRHAG
jgi:dTDP-4-amino-4,6-dideoxygalactose transaminase